MNMGLPFLHSCEMIHSATWSLQCKIDKCINSPSINLCPLTPSGGLGQ